MRAGMKWWLVLAMFVAVPAGCLTELPVPGDEAGAPAVSIEGQQLEGALRCPGGLVDCCGDGTCTLPQVCKLIQCESAEPEPVEEVASCGEGFVYCCGAGPCIALEVCNHTECASEEGDVKGLGGCADGLVDCCGDGVFIPAAACSNAPRDCQEPGPALEGS